MVINNFPAGRDLQSRPHRLGAADTPEHEETLRTRQHAPSGESEVSRKLALAFIRNDMVTLIATDAHNIHKRRPTLKAARDVLIPIIGADKVHALFNDNADAILS